MKFFVFILLSASALAQTPGGPKIVTFSRADAEHCKVVVFEGKPLLETTYNGTTVAINMPQNWANGEFSVYVAVLQAGAGEAQVNPKEFSALYSDADHTRLHWFDKGHDLDTEANVRAAGLGQPSTGGPGGPPGSGNDSSNAAPPPNHPEAMRSGDGIAPTKPEEEARQMQMRNGQGGPPPPRLDPAHPPVMLKHTTLKEGSKTGGYVFFRKPKGSQVVVTANGTLDEIDIPINGVIFRF